MLHPPKSSRVVVAMSGGVDSSVAALLLCQAGYDVVGMSMRLWTYEKDAKHGCCTPEDLDDARRVATHLGIPYYVSRFESTFETQVVEPFIESYLSGETPNPCVRCNTDVKFSALLSKAQDLGAQYLATGHYAKITSEHGHYRLLRPKDRQRDQTYFLFGLSQKELAQTLFPLADLHKDEVRALARAAGLPVADKPDSQEICFVPDTYEAFVEKRRGTQAIKKGNILDEQGHILAQHEGIHRFTVGQRKGLGVASPLPMYVLSVEDSGDVRVGREEQLWKDELHCRDLRWIHESPRDGDTVWAKIRSRSEPAEAIWTLVSRREGRLLFKSPQRAITPGQAVVLYQGEDVVGGAWISSASTSASFAQPA